MNNSGKLSIPAAIVISSVVIGGAYFAAGLYSTWARSSCAEQAGNLAQEKYKEFCEDFPSECSEDYEGKYKVADFNSGYETCLKYQGLKD